MLHESGRSERVAGACGQAGAGLALGVRRRGERHGALGLKMCVE